VKKILHFFRSSQFSEGFVRATNKYCTEQKNVFAIYGEAFWPEDNSYLYDKNVKYINVCFDISKPNFKMYLSSFDAIFVHGLFEPELCRFFSENDDLLKKLYLYFWGGDIPLTGSEENQNAKCKVIKNAAGIVTIFKSDYRRIVDIYHPQGDWYNVNYADPGLVDSTVKYMTPENQINTEDVLIQLGNSATETNNHIELLDILSKFKDEKMHIFMPMAYGEKEYAEKVIKYGKEIFGDKLIVLREFMQQDDYVKYLSKVNIGIFGMNRQQAGGNIHLLFANGCKMYFKCGGQNDEYYTNELGIKNFHIEDISDMDFSEFVKMDYQDREKNVEKIMQDLDIPEVMKKWNSMYSSCVGSDA
jgi:hypothetical protein